MVAFSVVMTVVVLNFHYKSSEAHELNPLVSKKIINSANHDKILNQVHFDQQRKKKCSKRSQIEIKLFIQLPNVIRWPSG